MFFMKRKISLSLRIAAVFFLCLSLQACSVPGRQGSSVPVQTDAGSGSTGSGSAAKNSSLTDPAGAEAEAASSSKAAGPDAAASADAAGHDTGSDQDDPFALSSPEKAAALSEKHGVRILCGEDIRQVYRDYTAAPLYEEEAVQDTLEVLDRTLSLYPPGFFPAIRAGFCDSVTICLARDLHAIDQASHLESAHAFTTVQDDTIWIVLNAEEPVSPSTLIHEFTHAADYRLLAMHELQEAEWNHLNPPGFSYYNSYLDEEGLDLRISAGREYTSFQESDLEGIWFYDPYSKTFAMEDRARLMEKLLENRAEGRPDLSLDRCFSSSHIQTKLRFYFYTLRQAFGSSSWPEQTVWEEVLSQCGSG